MTIPHRSPDDWRVLPFSEIAENITERVDDPSASGLDHYVGLEHLDPDSLKISRWGSPSDVEATKLRFYTGDVIYARRRAYQRKLGVAQWDGICSAHALVLRARPAVCLPQFLPYFLQSDQFHQRALDISVGSLSPTINWKTLAVQEFVLPSLSSQLQIAEVLEASDQCAYRFDAVDEALSSVAASLVDAAERLATGWLTLGDVLLEPPRNGYTIQPTDRATGTWSLTVGSVSEDGYSSDGLRRIVPPSNASRFLVEAGDLFVTRSNTLERVGLPARMPQNGPSPVYYSDLLMRLRPDEQVVPPGLLEHLLRAPRSRAFIRSIAAGTSASMKKINAQNLQRLPVPKLASSVIDDLLARLALLQEARHQERRHTADLRTVARRARETLLAGDM